MQIWRSFCFSHTNGLLKLFHLAYPFFRFPHCNESIWVSCFVFRLSKWLKFIRIFSCCFMRVSLDQTSPSTKLNVDYMNMSQLFNTFGSLNFKFINYILFVIIIELSVFYYQFSSWKSSMFASIGPILLRLVTSFWVIERAKHDGYRYIFKINSLPKIIVMLDGSLTKNGEYIAIY